MDILQRLKKIDLFQGVSQEKLQILARQAVYKKFPAQEIVIGETDSIKSFYVVLTGRMKLYKSSPEGKEQTIQLLEPGDPFGLCTAFATDVFPVSAMTIEESSVVLIPGQLMETVAMQEPRLLLNIIQILSRRLRDSMALIESLALKEIPGRLASFLLHLLSQSKESPEQLELAISQRELAKILGATPEALSRALRRLADDGVLQASGRTVRILNRAALDELAEGNG
jgi:CRP/FNR family transcriptional regulator, dissimilatory nitrate respiration regulator